MEPAAIIRFDLGMLESHLWEAANILCRPVDNNQSPETGKLEFAGALASWMKSSGDVRRALGMILEGRS